MELDRIDEVLFIPESAGDVVLQWLVSASTCICANPMKFTVHLRETASPADNRIVFSREEVRGRKPRHSLRRVALGLRAKAESGIRACVIEPREIGTLESGQSCITSRPSFEA